MTLYTVRSTGRTWSIFCRTTGAIVEGGFFCRDAAIEACTDWCSTHGVCA